MSMMRFSGDMTHLPTDAGFTDLPHSSNGTSPNRSCSHLQGIFHCYVWLPEGNWMPFGWKNNIDSFHASDSNGKIHVLASRRKVHVLHLAGGIPTRLKNIWKSIGMTIPKIWKNKTCSKPPTSLSFLWLSSSFFGESSSPLGFFMCCFHVQTQSSPVC